MSYESIQIDKSHIIWETAKGTLILLPKKCKYEGYQFWIPSSFVKKGTAPQTVIITFRDDFKFKLEKYRRVSHDKKELIDAVFVPAIEIKEMFGITEHLEEYQSRYVDANYLNHTQNYGHAVKKGGFAERELIRHKDILKLYPTAKVREIKVGKWIKKPSPAECEYLCSLCRYSFIEGDPTAKCEFNYCPNCGAAMTEISEAHYVY